MTGTGGTITGTGTGGTMTGTGTGGTMTGTGMTENEKNNIISFFYKLYKALSLHSLWHGADPSKLLNLLCFSFYFLFYTLFVLNVIIRKEFKKISKPT